MALTEQEVQEFQASIRSDNAAVMAGQITEAEFWGRVHARDDRIKSVSPEDRMRLQNGTWD